MNEQQEPEALPPLPEPTVFSEYANEYLYFTADQMNARYRQGYEDARAALAAAAAPASQFHVTALRNVLATLKRLNDQPDGPIKDTLWYSRAETLFDYIERSLEEFAVAPPAPAPEAGDLARERASRQEAQRQLEGCKERLARARVQLMRELREQGWTPPQAAPAPEPAQSKMPGFIRAEVERAIANAKNTRGMSTHDGKAVIGHDKLAYLLAAADHALATKPLAPQPALVPLTEEQIVEFFKGADSEDKGRWSVAMAFARAIERAHGIAGEQQR